MASPRPLWPDTLHAAAGLSRQRTLHLCSRRLQPCVRVLMQRLVSSLAVSGPAHRAASPPARVPRLLTHDRSLHSVTPLVRSFVLWVVPHRPPTRTTTTFADFSLQHALSPFQAQGEISPGKNALLHRTTAGSTPLRLDHESFAVSGPLALLRQRLLSSSCPSARSFALRFLPTLGHPCAVALTSLAVINLRRDLHPQECAHAGRTKKRLLDEALIITTACSHLR